MAYRRLILILLGIGLITGAAIHLSNAGRSPLAVPLGFDALAFPEELVRQASRDEAMRHGLIEPTKETFVVMTVGSYLTLRNQVTTDELLAGQGLTRETPLVVYQVEGKFGPLAGFGSGSGATNTVALTLAINGIEGRIFEAIASTADSELLDLSQVPQDIGSRSDFVPPPLVRHGEKIAP